MKFKIGDRVEVDGNRDAIILSCYCDNMYEVRLWSNFRHVGDVVVDEKYIKLVK